MKFGEEVQFVPDRVRGDGGIEAYRLDDGIVYQCYAPEDAFTADAQTDAQKGKIRRDIKKLVDKPDETAHLLGHGYLIRRWVLLTPEYDDKELLAYARLKSLRTRELAPRPPWCHDDFQVVVASDRDLFAEQLSILAGIEGGALKLNLEQPPEAEAIASFDESLAERLRLKSTENPILAGNPDVMDRFCTDTILDFVYGAGQLHVLEERYTLAFDAVARRARVTFRTITRRLADGAGDPADLEDLAQQLAQNLSVDIPALAPVACEELARHYVASWLIDCPLRFRIQNDHA
jgi:hypothetical protein